MPSGSTASAAGAEPVAHATCARASSAATDAAAPPLRVEVCAALPDRVVRVALELPAGATLDQALAGARPALPAQVLAPGGGVPAAGVFGRLRPGSWPLRDGDRVEVYRPLTVDPKVARARRAASRRSRGR